MSNPVLRLGILGASETIQTTILPTLASLQTHFKLTIIYDQNDTVAKHCQKEFNITHSTTSTLELLTHPEVDLVLNLLPFEYHEQYTITALEAGKHVMVEVPLTLSVNGLRCIRKATTKGLAVRSNYSANKDTIYDPPKVFVGCARRYAPCFTDIFKKELASLGRVYYARCRNISGPLRPPTLRQPSVNSTTGSDLDVNGSGNGVAVKNGTTNGHGDDNDTNKGNDVTPVTSTEHFTALLADVFGAEDLTPDRVAFCRFLGDMGCHDLSLMRESLGFPDAVANVAITVPFYSTIFHYTDSESICGSSGEEHPFTVMYETGVDSVPRCNAHLTVYGAKKTISVEYDVPSLARPAASDGGGQVKVIVEEMESEDEHSNGNGNGVSNGNGVVYRPIVKRAEYVSSVAESYEREFLAMHSYLNRGYQTGTGAEAKTTANDALMDLRLLNMIFEHYDRQCGTIRTPLG
ncbi:hypothetical protein N7486_007350 [Penicillium sp. IBT 16267x]|nr:hypothetical protein N7486_007350 [Penicillium sp. IBT 16267x]